MYNGPVHFNIKRALFNMNMHKSTDIYKIPYNICIHVYSVLHCRPCPANAKPIAYFDGRYSTDANRWGIIYFNYKHGPVRCEKNSNVKWTLK